MDKPRRRWHRKDRESVDKTVSAEVSLEQGTPSERTELGQTSAACVPSISLRNGMVVPKLGLGTWEPKEPGDCRRAILAAIGIGYRLFDLNMEREAEAGAAILESGIPRREFCVLTKLRPRDHGNVHRVFSACQSSLQRLQTDYVDLYLVQNPRGGHLVSTWRAMLELRDAGLVRAVGTSNFGCQQLQGLADAGLEMPQVNQVELHVWWQQQELVDFCRKHGVALMAYAPLGRARLFGKTSLRRVAGARGFTEAELCLAWCLQQGYMCVPKSADLNHLRENWNTAMRASAGAYDLVQTELSLLDRNRRVCEAASSAQELAWEDVYMSKPLRNSEPQR
eukprot:TRINITY_DN31161_c0_g1_i1.p1 TRINITY_DN31161_c0_g1~~TRINITY_DN31161_c0_g1_i1.p1  ORF type:complete len:352 (-),score=33.85 TRINITY_DN31161_c0_g1_i1:21-1031(-)